MKTQDKNTQQNSPQKISHLHAKRKRVQIFFEDQAVSGKGAKQAHKGECDLNIIVKRAIEQGTPLPIQQQPMLYKDFSSAPDYQTAMEIITKANSQFELLPAEHREHFGNDPTKFLEFVNNPQNLDQMVKIGLAVPTKAGPRSSGQQPPVGKQSDKKSQTKKEPNEED